jgi:hypothetical protein
MIAKLGGGPGQVWLITIRAKEGLQDDTEVLKRVLLWLTDKRFRLDCGHHITFGHFLGNDITILKGKRLKVICSQCGY